VALQHLPDPLPLSLPPAASGQRVHPRAVVWIRLCTEQQPDRTDLLQLVGEQPDSARVEERGRNRDRRRFCEIDAHAMQ
jgi:hypothetical protein